MTVEQISQYLTWAIYLIIFCIAAIKAVRRPTRANIDIAILFAAPAAIIGISIVSSLGLFQANAFSNALSTTLLLAWSYMLLRLVDDFSVLPSWLGLTAPIVLAILVISNFLIPPPRPVLFGTVEILYLIAMFLINAIAFFRDSSHASGVTMRRMRAVALGSLALCVLFVLLEVLAFVPGALNSLSWLIDLTELGSGILYFIGFATPTIIRRAWQEPELRAFLGRAASLPRLPDTDSILRELENGAAASVGAPGASIGLWDNNIKRLRFKMTDGYFDSEPNETLTGRVFITQKPLFSGDTARDNPVTADVSRSHNALALLAAPITAGDKKLGVLAVYALRAPIFAEEDLELVRLLADQAAVILESRDLIDEAARVQAREEVTRLKEDFLSAAAHDLKTPLTILVMQTEMLERRALRAPQAPVDIVSLQKLKKEAYRLKDLVLELLDAARTEQGRLVGEFESVDLVTAAKDACAHHGSPRHPCSVEADGQVAGIYDPNRILQLIENLVENAIKYSPDGGPITIKLWREPKSPISAGEIGDQTIRDALGTPESTTGEWNYFTVTDHGIGIPRDDLPNVFERFHRGSNVDDRHFAGMGLGLFICQGIVEQHGGRIWVESPTSTTALNIGNQNGHHTGDLSSVAAGTNITHSRSYEEINSIGGQNNNDIIQRKPGTTFHVALPAVPPALPAEPTAAGATAGR